MNELMNSIVEEVFVVSRRVLLCVVRLLAVVLLDHLHVDGRVYDDDCAVLDADGVDDTDVVVYRRAVLDSDAVSDTDGVAYLCVVFYCFASHQHVCQQAEGYADQAPEADSQTATASFQFLFVVVHNIII